MNIRTSKSISVLKGYIEVNALRIKVFICSFIHYSEMHGIQRRNIHRDSFDTCFLQIFQFCFTVSIQVPIITAKCLIFNFCMNRIWILLFTASICRINSYTINCIVIYTCNFLFVLTVVHIIHIQRCICHCHILGSNFILTLCISINLKCDILIISKQILRFRFRYLIRGKASLTIFNLFSNRNTEIFIEIILFIRKGYIIGSIWILFQVTDNDIRTLQRLYNNLFAYSVVILIQCISIRCLGFFHDIHRSTRICFQ